MSEYTPTTDEMRNVYASVQALGIRSGPPGAIEYNHGKAKFDRWLAEVERAAAAKALAKVRSEIRQIPRWWNTELGYGEFDLQPLGPYETSEKGAYMEVMRVLDECAAEIREGKLS